MGELLSNQETVSDRSMEIYPVIHINDKNQALEQTEIALENGADGVFLIEKRKKIPPQNLTSVFDHVASAHPDDFIGLNYLSISHPVDVFEYVHDKFNSGEISRLPNAVWVGNTIRDTLRKSEFGSVELLRHEYPELKTIKYLGGIAFKYNPLYTDDPKKAADQVRAFSFDMDVIVTTGPRTGESASIEKVKAMKEAAKEKPLALASGVSEDNIDDYKGEVDIILASTAVETEPNSGEFDIRKLRRLIELAHS
jgi:hypothetical protein